MITKKFWIRVLGFLWLAGIALGEGMKSLTLRLWRRW